MYNPDIHHRKSIRLKGYDYSRSGAYFLTICTQNRECLFGDVRDGEMVMNDAGECIRKCWLGFPNRFPILSIDEFVVMPNHMHGVIMINGMDKSKNKGKYNEKGEHKVRPYGTKNDANCIEPCVRPSSYIHIHGTSGNSIGRIIQAFKSITTYQYAIGVKKYNWQTFPGKLWQRNYFDRIIRNETELNHIRKYILNNPLRWHLDKENPDGNSDEDEKKFWKEFS